MGLSLKMCKEMSVWFKIRLNPWYIWIPSNPNLYSTKFIMKMRWQTIASNVSIRTISPTTKSLWLCSSVYCGPQHPSRRKMVGGRNRQPKTMKNTFIWCEDLIPWQNLQNALQLVLYTIHLTETSTLTSQLHPWRYPLLFILPKIFHSGVCLIYGTYL